jgi:hypothetical protein
VTLPRSLRTNNPGAMNYGDFARRHGAVGSDGRLAIFPDQDTGFKAMSSLLDIYGRRGQNSISTIIGGTPDNPNRAWAPRGVDNNSTDTYIQKVAGHLGIDPTAPVPPEKRQDLMRAMAAYEAGVPIAALPTGSQPVQAAAQPAMNTTAEPSGVGLMTTTKRDPTMMERISGGLLNPITLAGLAGLESSSRGASAFEGIGRGLNASRALTDQWNAEADRKQKEAAKQAMDRLFDNPGTFGALPPGLLEISKATRDPSAILEHIARTNKDPLEVESRRLQNDKMRRDLAKPEEDGSKLMEVNGQIVRVPRQGQANVVYGTDLVSQRREQVKAAGLDPESPQGKVFIATGKMPREDQQPLTATDKKAIMEADEFVVAADTGIKLLDEALTLSPQANSGLGASTRAVIGNNLPDWFVSNSISSPASSEATTNFENILMGQALSQLKSTFGAAPTEGERKILMELQGSVNQPIAVRDKILKRAKELAEIRKQQYVERAAGLRGNTYYKPGNPAAPTAAAPTASAPAPAAGGNGDVLKQARDAISRGAPRDAVIKRLRDAGIDPAGL